MVNGAKTFITSGCRADLVTVAVRTSGPGRSALASGWSTVQVLLTLAVFTAGCGRDQALKVEAARVSVAIEALVAAEVRAKAPALSALEATACTQPVVCAARQSCLDAFRPQVAAADKQREARTLLDRHDASLAAQIDARLDEAERLQVEARQLQERCLASATAMRQTYRL